MGAFGELLKVYWGFNSEPVEVRKPKEKTKLELKYENDAAEFEALGLKERKILIDLMGEHYTRNYSKQFMYFNDWIEFTDNGKIEWYDKLNQIFDAKNLHN